MPQDVQYDPITGEIGAVVTYSEAPREWPAHPARVIIDKPNKYVPLHALRGHKVDLLDPFNRHVREKTPAEKAADAVLDAAQVGGK
jgi:hypothetical protein